MIPTAKSVSAPTSQVLNALSDFSFFIFRFRLLIFLSPPYKYIVSYRTPYVNNFVAFFSIATVVSRLQFVPVLGSGFFGRISELSPSGDWFYLIDYKR